ncbi:MAG: hypothetical protein OEU84_05745 [Xanthomonadales bacterium]|nr:hypothetical protein [Xanthomonadales bacterium]MDH4019086.1 hypothetical protein [Xanthomonadales bacterium]
MLLKVAAPECPLVAAMLTSQQLYNDLNLGYKARIATALAGLLILLLVVLPHTGHALPLRLAAGPAPLQITRGFSR